MPIKMINMSPPKFPFRREDDHIIRPLTPFEAAMTIEMQLLQRKPKVWVDLPKEWSLEDIEKMLQHLKKNP